MAEYARPEVLVDTNWVAEHLNDPKVRIVESNEDILLYDQGHIPGAVKIDWVADLNDPVVRDYLDRERFEQLLAAKGISNDTTVIFYGDKNNWWATYALYWVFKLFGHEDAQILNGGRAKWIAEGRELSKTVPSYPAGSYTAAERDDTTIRAFRDQVQGAHQEERCGAGGCALAGRVQRREDPYARVPAGGHAARRPYPHRSQHPVGAGGAARTARSRAARSFRRSTAARA